MLGLKWVVLLLAVAVAAPRVLRTSSSDVRDFFWRDGSLCLANTAMFVIGALVALRLWAFFFVPYRRIKTLEDNKDFLPRQVRAGARRRGDLMPPFPNGWFRLFSSSEVGVGEVRYMQALGQHFAVFRGKDGKVSIVEAYCPHLGANMALTGRVVENCLECPFHGWQFDGTGQCVHVPYAPNGCPPKNAKVRVYPSMEANSLIMVWFHADGLEPTWYPPTPQEINSKNFLSWSIDGISQHQITAHPQEIPENGSDTAHLGILHQDFFLPSCGLLGHGWQATWHPGDPDEEGKAPTGHLAHINLTQWFTLCGFKIPGTTVVVSITQVGPGLVHLHFTLPFGRVMIIETVTAVGILHCQAHHTVFTEWKVPGFIGKFILHSLVTQFERDVPIWNTKTFLKKSLTIKEDGQISKFRGWFKQFYSEGSPNVGLDTSW
eukprot:gnl/Hemi2/4270_TR1490_c0_g1_i1.p1 gnl/Hemi2/4270_TR1490_c0_g1~~gnl/Hemi2/4270_TR1490_c0_g1_i1.p1  ORF type:complete len:433 (+),score=136.40 gnl/Hemi2/4270_TR1490_c0_g1_i1:63-1361(+)